jgi:hypothetical protein
MNIDATQKPALNFVQRVVRLIPGLASLKNPGRPTQKEDKSSTSPAAVQEMAAHLLKAARFVRDNGIHRLVLDVGTYASHAEANAEISELLGDYAGKIRTDYHAEHLLDPREYGMWRNRRLSREAAAYEVFAIITVNQEGMVRSFLTDGRLTPDAAPQFKDGTVLYEVSFRVPTSGAFLAPLVAGNQTYQNYRVLLNPENPEDLKLLAQGQVAHARDKGWFNGAFNQALPQYQENLAGLIHGVRQLRGLGSRYHESNRETSDP